jgi:hypothetical protein
MRISKKICVLIILIVLCIGIFFGIREVARYLDPTSVQYDGRTYMKSDKPIDSEDLAIIESLDQTGVQVEGMEVYDDLDHPYASTVIYLKTRDGDFVVYALSGGP